MICNDICIVYSKMRNRDNSLLMHFEELLMSWTKSSLQIQEPCLHSAFAIAAHVVSFVHIRPTATKTWEKVTSYHLGRKDNLRWMSGVKRIDPWYRFVHRIASTSCVNYSR